MRVFRARDESPLENDTTTFALGAVGGLAIGVLLSRLFGPGQPLREAAGGAVRRLRPARLRRLGFEQEGLDRLEDAVLEAFLGDEVLCERGVDIGAISPGIIELSGSVWSQDEAHRAVSLVNRIPGVRTVVNRLEVRSARRPPRSTFGELDTFDETFTHLGDGRVGGMGRRRQSRATDPERPDDSQEMREDALAAADRDQWEDEGFARGVSRKDARPEVHSAERAAFDEDELDNQDPHGKHADQTLDRPRQELRTESRVQQDVKPGTRLDLERSGFSLDTPPPRDRED